MKTVSYEVQVRRHGSRKWIMLMRNPKSAVLFKRLEEFNLGARLMTPAPKYRLVRVTTVRTEKVIKQRNTRSRE